MQIPILFAFFVSSTLSLVLSLVVGKTIEALEDRKGAINMLHYFYWSVNLITMSLGYILYRG